MDGDGFRDAAPELWRVAYRVGFRLLQDPTAAEDVAAEALARAWSRWSRVSGYAEPWVARVAGNLALGQLRRRRPTTMAAPRPATDMDERVVTRLQLASALQGLTSRQRDVVVLRYLADLPEAEVARLLGCSTGSVKTHASRGLSTLRRTLGPLGGIDARLA